MTLEGRGLLVPPRPRSTLPEVTIETSFFWASGGDGRLRILRCRSCGYYVHPPLPLCPECLSREVQPEAVSGAGVVHSCTVNHQVWDAATVEPYVVALVELAEQPGLRILTNIVGCPLDEVRIGLRVDVRFEDHGDVYLPVFVPAVGA
jgi:uncharacterized OB-fold protein